MRLLICVTFHYNRNRLKYLKKVLKGFVNNYKNSHIYIITNTFNQFELSNIKLAFPTHLINDIILIKSFKVVINKSDSLLSIIIFIILY